MRALTLLLLAGSMTALPIVEAAAQARRGGARSPERARSVQPRPPQPATESRPAVYADEPGRYPGRGGGGGGSPGP